MSEVSDEDELKAIPETVPLNAIIYYLSNVQARLAYDEAVSDLRLWYNNSEKRAKILTKWQSLRLMRELKRSPDASEVEVFRKFVAKLMSLPKQLHSDYEEDKSLTDRLMTVIDILSILVTVKDRMPRTALEQATRIANRSSEIAGIGGFSVAHYACCSESKDRDHALYHLGLSYGTGARRSVRPFGNKGPGEIYRNVRGRSGKFKQ